MREFTVMFRSVKEVLEFMALANQQPFEVFFARPGGMSDAKSVFSCLGLQLDRPQVVCFEAEYAEAAAFCELLRPYMFQGATA